MMLGWLFRFLFGSHTSPSSDRGQGNPRLLLVRITCEECLPSHYVRFHGVHRGYCWWWLRHDDGWFSAVELPRGDLPLNHLVYLEPGRYVLRTGRDVAAIRRVIWVSKRGGLGDYCPNPDSPG